MRKKILPLSMLVLGLSLQAQQVLTFVGDGATVAVKSDALVYSGGTVKVAGDGVVIDEGKVKIDNGGFETNKTDGSNFVLKMNDTSTFKSYGQLWVNNDSQAKVTGHVQKEFGAVADGAYQQLALPFEGKKFSELSAELGKTFTTNRWTEDEILAYNNGKVRSDHQKDLDATTNSTDASSGNYRSTYYMLGAKNTDFATIHTVKGTPFSSDNHNVILSGAGTGIDFGTDGAKRNWYGEKYSSYLYDSFYTYTTVFTGTYGKNIYQFGNPFLTNLDLTKIDSDLQEKIQGIRVSVSSVTYNSNVGGHYSAYKYVTFTSSGSPVGDVELAVIKPLQTFVIKMKDNETGNLDLATLRTFDSTPSNSNITAGEGTMSVAPKTSLELKTQAVGGFKELKTNASSSVKQLGVIALDENNNELGRTYYAVYPEAHTGTIASSTQVTATSNDIIGTFEETPEGGYDVNAANAYWLYINEANENEYKGKGIELGIYSDQIKKFKFELRERARLLADGVSALSSNESFYIADGNNVSKIQQGGIYDVNTDSFKLYYGKPLEQTLTTTELQKPSQCIIVYDKNISAHRLVFDPNWSVADVQVYDLSGQLIISEKEVKTSSDFIIKLPKSLTATYVVKAVSKEGKVYSQKIVK